MTMLAAFANGLAKGFGAFGWCLAFLGGWAAVLAIFATIGTILRAVCGKEEDEDD